MNNDLDNNHSSVNSSKYIANRAKPIEKKFYQESYIKDKNRGMFDIQSKGNKTIFFDSDNDKRPSNQKELLISRAVSKYPANFAPGPSPYNTEIIRGYYVGSQEESRFNQPYQMPLNQYEEEINEEGQRNKYYFRENIKNGGYNMENEGNAGEDLEEMENGNEYQYNADNSPLQNIGQYNQYIGDGIVRNNILNYSPNLNGENSLYYKKKKLGKYNYNIGLENEYQSQNENEEGQYNMESPANNNQNINYNMKPYQRRHILGNLSDSASPEEYAIKYNNQISPSNPDNNSRIYVKPKANYNNLNNGISTEELGIESRESPNNAANNGANLRRPFQFTDYDENDNNNYNRLNNYDEDSVNIVEPPLFNYPNNERYKGGKVDLNNFALINKRARRDREDQDRDEDEDEEDIIDKKKEDEYEFDIGEEKLQNIIKLQKAIKNHMKDRNIKATKIQSFWRASSTRKIMNLYHDLDEFIYLLSKVHFNHFSDNFYFFINQLFNAYKANTLDNNQIDSLEDEEKEDNENSNNDNEDEKITKNIQKNKNYEELLNDYHNLEKKYNDLVNNNKYSKFSTTKRSALNNDITSVPGETTIGSIKTDNKLKFKMHNNSSNYLNIKQNLTFSNDYNDDAEVKNKEYDHRFYTPKYEKEESFNDNSKDKRFSYSSIHSEENSKYFDNEQPKGATSHRKGKFQRIGMLSLNKKKDKILTYSPSIENEYQSRENSKNKNNNENINGKRVNNISVIMPKHEEEFGIIKSEIDDNKNKLNSIKIKEIEEKIFNKFVNNFSKNLFIVKNNKVHLKNENNDKKRINHFDNEFIFPENENTMELVAPKKSDEQIIKDIFDNEKLLKKIKNKLGKKTYEKKLLKNYENSFAIENKKPKDILRKNNNEIQQNINNLEIIQNNHRNFALSKLDFQSNHLFLGEPKISKKNKVSKNFAPAFENEINIERMPEKSLDKSKIFSKEKTFPSFNINKDNNSFTINNNIPKSELKLTSFKVEQMIVDNVYNDKLDFNDLLIKRQKKNDNKREQEIVYIPIKANSFKRLRKSKRTKENYFSFKPKLKNSDIADNNLENKKYIKKELLPINENHFSIKSEYYYVETDSKEIPEILEKTIKETIIVNQDSKELNKFNKQLLLSNESNFYIKANKQKNKYLLDIEANELMIPNKIGKNLRNIKKIKAINKNDNFIISGEMKQWEDLNPIANDEFCYINEFDNKNKNDDLYENINKEPDENIGYNDNQYLYIDNLLNIELVDQFEIIDKIQEKNIYKILVESKQNIITIEGSNIDREDKEMQTDIRKFNITTKKILKKEAIIRRKKFFDNNITSENSFPIYGTINKKINDNDNENDKDDKNKKESNNSKDNPDNKKELKLYAESNCELIFKKIKKKSKDIETATDPVKEYKVNLIPITDKQLFFKRKQIKKEEKQTEIEDDLKKNECNNFDDRSKLKIENIRNNNITLKGKKKKMKESETQINKQFYDLKTYNNNQMALNESFKPKKENIIIENENLEIIAIEKELKDYKKKEIIFEEEKINDINLESRNRTFPKLDINNCLIETFNKKEKEKIEFEKIKNESLMFKSNKKEKENVKEYTIECNQILILSKEKEIQVKEIPRIYKNLNINKLGEYNVKGKEKKKKKLKESETQMDDNSFNLNVNQESKNQLNDEIKLKRKKDKNKINKKEVFQLFIEGVKIKYDNKIFTNLDIKRCNDQTLYGKEKEKEILELIKNVDIIINAKEREPFQDIKNDDILINAKEREPFRNIKNDDIIINAKEREPFQNIKNDNIIINAKEREPYLNIKNDDILINAKERKPFQNIKTDDILIYAKERETLENIKNEDFIINAKERETLENIKNDDFIIKQNEKKTASVETLIDKDLNSNLIDYNNENLIFKSIKPKKKENIIVKNKNINIKEAKNKKESKLIVEEQQTLNIDKIKTKKEFKEDAISICYSENFAIINEVIIPKNNLSKKLNILLNSDNEDSQLNTNMISNLEESIEKRIEIIGNPSISNINNENNNEIILPKLSEEESPFNDKIDLDTNLKKQFINNIVQDRLEKEKQKNMDKTKNKVMNLFRAFKLKNALGKNLKNKKDFISKLKDFKRNKENKQLSFVNAINYNYISKKEQKLEACTDTDNLEEVYDKIYQKNKNYNLIIEKNNIIELKNGKKEINLIEVDKVINAQFTIFQKKNKLKDNETEITDEINKL